MATTRLSQRVKDILDGKEQADNASWPPDQAPPAFDIPVIYVLDEVARIYQHSKRAVDEPSTLSSTTKYCMGLARYTQSPLNEYAALGADITAISFEEEDQHLVPKEKLLLAFERVLVDVVNKVGVDVNRAATDSYYQHLLPFVCGLGPRKVQLLVKKIGAMGGNLLNRDQFIKGGLLMTKIFLNATGFLCISHEAEHKPGKNRHNDEGDQDPLDDTRIHPEDYELVRKMAMRLSLAKKTSTTNTLLMSSLSDNEKKLNELNLDEFAVNMYETNEDRKHMI